jgi:hypothetical protein
VIIGFAIDLEKNIVFPRSSKMKASLIFENFRKNETQDVIEKIKY